MGQKVHPNAFRLGVYKPWQSRWYADREYRDLLLEDMKMRQLITNRLRNASISKVETERSANQVTVIIWTAKPGIVIGKGGASVDQLRDDLEKLSGKRVRVTIQEIKHPELDAALVAQNVASQLERRIAFRRAIKQGVLRTMRAGAKGVKIAVAGRLGGAEMSRREWDRDGRVPLHTLKANIDFGQTDARTTFGRIGVSVWVYVGDFDTSFKAEDTFEEIPARLLDGGEPHAAGRVATPLAAAVAAPAAAPSAAVPSPAAVEPAPEAPDAGAPAGEPATEPAAATAITSEGPAKPRARRATKAAPAESEAEAKAAPKRPARRAVGRADNAPTKDSTVTKKPARRSTKSATGGAPTSTGREKEKKQ